MQSKNNFFVVVVIAILLAIGLQSETGTKLFNSETDYANMLAGTLYDAVGDLNSDVEAGIAYFDNGNKPVTVVGRTMFVEFDTTGDLGWPTVVNGVTITFLRDDGTRSRSFYYNFRV